ncbi:glycine--tRNA ligase alpha subunit [Clostridium sp. CAG:813]|nr:glycine--tRNA ligase alpha subunit [Clostridium sp. CAG:813]
MLTGLLVKRVISKDERNNFIGRVRTMASAVARMYVEQREAMGFPLCKKETGVV